MVRRTLLEQIEGFRTGYEGAQDYDLVLRLMDRTTRIRHLAKVLYHWRKIPESTASAIAAKPFADEAGKRALQDYFRRNTVNAEVLSSGYPCFYRTRFAIRDEPLVSIVLPPVGDNVPLSSEARAVCDRTVRTLAERTRYRRFEVLLVTSPGNAAYGKEIIRDLPGREIPVDDGLIKHRTGAAEPGGFSRRRRTSAVPRLGTGCLRRRMVDRPPGILPAGGYRRRRRKAVYPDGSLEHVGMLVGVNGVAASALYRHPSSSPGYWGNAIVARNCSAVSGACLMTRRRVFEQARRFREDLCWFADVDYCLRIISAGYRVVFTPYASLVHIGSFAPVGCDASREEASRLQEAWGDRLAADPSYNPNLSRDSPDYEPDLSFRFS